MRVGLNSEQIERVSGHLKAAADLPNFSYCGGVYPPEGGKGVVDYFFATVLHQYGFWYDDGTSYVEPMYARLGGRVLKGSDFMWEASRRAAGKNPEFPTPLFQSRLTGRQLRMFWAEDSGSCPLPQFESHLRLARGYGRDVGSAGRTPVEIVEETNASSTPLKTFLEIAGKLSGYREDPLQKKALLLALILHRRPEGFLRVTDPERWAPIVDYHNMRSALRVGLIQIEDEKLLGKIIERKFVSRKEEAEIRRKTYDALLLLMEKSGRSIARVDALFFSARKRCPEMTPPECPKCVLEPVCLKKKSLFQPVFRTTYY